MLACSLAVLGLWKAAVPRIESDCLPLVLYPWLVLAGLPRRSPVQAPWHALIHELALLGPPLALAVRLDWKSGASVSSVVEVALTGALLMALLSLGANLASRAGVSRTLHGFVWFSGVLVLPLACAVLEWGEPRTWLARLARVSPLGWIHGRTLFDPPAGFPWAALASCLVLLWLGGIAREHASKP